MNQSKKKQKPIYEQPYYNINIDRLEDDGRTTLMVKNIPNKYNRELLLNSINKKHDKHYDFFYVPIDF